MKRNKWEKSEGKVKLGGCCADSRKQGAEDGRGGRLCTYSVMRTELILPGRCVLCEWRQTGRPEMAPIHPTVSVSRLSSVLAAGVRQRWGRWVCPVSSSFLSRGFSFFFWGADSKGLWRSNSPHQIIKELPFALICFAQLDFGFRQVHTACCRLQKCMPQPQPWSEEIGVNVSRSHKGAFTVPKLASEQGLFFVAVADMTRVCGSLWLMRLLALFQRRRVIFSQL